MKKILTCILITIFLLVTFCFNAYAIKNNGEILNNRFARENGEVGKEHIVGDINGNNYMLLSCTKIEEIDSNTTIESIFNDIKDELDNPDYKKDIVDESGLLKSYVLIGKYDYRPTAVDNMGYPSMQELAEMSIENGNIEYYDYIYSSGEQRTITKDDNVLTGMVICKKIEPEEKSAPDLYPYIQYKIGDEDLEGINLGKENEELVNYFDEHMITTKGILSEIGKLNEGVTYDEIKTLYEEYFKNNELILKYRDSEGKDKETNFLKIAIEAQHNKNGSEVVKTGDRIAFYITDMEIKDIPNDFPINLLNIQYKVEVTGNLIVKGDITGTGEVDVTDLSTLQEELVDNIVLDDLQKEAGDMDDSGEIDIVDLSELQDYIVNK